MHGLHKAASLPSGNSAFRRMLLASFCLLMMLFLPVTMAAGAEEPPQQPDGAPLLTEEQQQLWERTRGQLEERYIALGRTPHPMPLAQSACIRVPLTMDGSQMGQLPWDVRLLLSFDQNVLLGAPYNDQPLFKRLLAGVLHPELSLAEILPVYAESILGGKPDGTWPKEGLAVFLQETGAMPALLNLPQLGGDEIPGLWPARNGQNYSLVLHFSYDDMPEYYLRSTCLFSYVLQYLDWEGATDDYFYSDKDGFPTDRCRFWDEARDREIALAVQPMLRRLNKALYDSLEAVYGEE